MSTKNYSLHTLFVEEPDSCFITDCNGSWTRTLFQAHASTFKEQLQAMQIAPGERVGILAPISKEYAAFILACMLAKVTVVPLNERETTDTLCTLIKQAACKIVLAADSCSEHLPQVASWNDFSSITPINDASKALLHAEQETLVMFTSGSSGPAKGVIHTIGSLFEAAIASNKATGFCKDHEWLISLPLYHIAGFQILLRALVSGGSLRIAPSSSAQTILELLQEKQTDYISLVPTQLLELEEHSTLAFLNNRIRTVLLGGAAIDPNLIKIFQDSPITILPCYGMTETASHISCVQLSDPPAALETAGKPIDGVDLTFAESGEILVHTPQLASAYIQPDGSIETVQTPFKTNDLGSLDEQGFLRVHGRNDDIIISGGENISLREIENLILRCPVVKACAVIPAKHPRWGTRPHLFVEYIATAERETLSLEEYITKTLPAFKQPDSITVLTKLPRTSIGKIDCTALTGLLK